MSIETRFGEQGGIPVLHVAGEFDASATPQFRSAVLRACPAGCDRLAVDLSDVHYIESAAIGALIEVHATVEARGGRVAVICPPSGPARILQLSGLAHVVPVFENSASAISFLS